MNVLVLQRMFSQLPAIPAHPELWQPTATTSAEVGRTHGDFTKPGVPHLQSGLTTTPTP